MLLMDSIIQLAEMSSSPFLAHVPLFARKLKACPRFILSERAATTACELSLSRPKIFREVMNHLHVPYLTMWVEWDDRGREILRQKLENEPGAITQVRPLPKRLGFLIETNEPGRSGQITWAWTSPETIYIPKMGVDIPNLAPISAYFDLDRDDLKTAKQQEFINKLVLAKFWRDNTVQQNSLLSIWDTVEHKPSEWGRRALDQMSAHKSITGIPGNQVELHSYADVVGEYIMVWAVLMMLTAYNRAVLYEKVDLSRLNKARRKRGNTELLDYSTVNINMDLPQVSRRGSGQPLDYRRKSPRIHLVSSYLAPRRDGTHRLVFSYVRGRGGLVARNINIK